MKLIKYQCDMCKRHSDKKFCYELAITKLPTLRDGSGFKEYDLCNECIKTIKELLEK